MRTHMQHRCSSPRPSLAEPAQRRAELGPNRLPPIRQPSNLIEVHPDSPLQQMEQQRIGLRLQECPVADEPLLVGFPAGGREW